MNKIGNPNCPPKVITVHRDHHEVCISKYFIQSLQFSQFIIRLTSGEVYVRYVVSGSF